MTNDEDVRQVPLVPARRTPWVWPPIVIVVLALASGLNIVANWLAVVASVAGAGVVWQWRQRRGAR